ncbi:MAG: T9SS type A sorting domain-containing protein [Acidimicrobiia bacterium]
MNKLSSLCLLCVLGIAPVASAQYTGGSGDGYDSAALATSFPAFVNFYAGGSGDGYDNATRGGTLTVIKDTVPDDAQDFAYTTTGGLSPSTFDLDDDADGTLSNTQTFTDVTPGTYTVSEMAVAGYDVAIVCVDPSGGTTTAGNTATIDLAAGEMVTCTFTNTAGSDVVVAKLDAVVLDVVGSPGADPGDRIKYSVEIENVGGREATGVTFTDTVDPNTSLDCTSVTPAPTSCTLGLGGSLTIDVGTLAGSGGKITIMFEVEVVSPFPKTVFEVVNQGTVSGDDFADVQTDDPDTAAIGDATVTEINRADVKITKTLIDVSHNDDGTTEATFLLRVTNKGPNDASGVYVSDPESDGILFVSSSTDDYDEDTGLWTIGVLANGASATMTITFKADSDNNITNIAQVFAEQPDPDVSNNLAGSQAQHDNPDLDRFRADLSLEKTVDNETPVMGGIATFTIVVTNHGPSTTAGVKVRERLPGGLEFVSATASNASTCPACGYDDSLGVWIVGHVVVGTTVRLELVARVVGTGQIVNTAEVIESHLPDLDSVLGNGDPTEDDQDSATIEVSSGKATSTVSDGGEGIPTEFELQGNYPNPFNPETVIPLGLPQSSHVVLEVYNLLGRRVAVLLDEPLSAGRHAVTWYAVDEPSGVYLVRLVAGKVQKTQRVTLVK